VAEVTQVWKKGEKLFFTKHWWYHSISEHRTNTKQNINYLTRHATKYEVWSVGLYSYLVRGSFHDALNKNLRRITGWILKGSSWSDPSTGPKSVCCDCRKPRKQGQMSQPRFEPDTYVTAVAYDAYGGGIARGSGPLTVPSRTARHTATQQTDLLHLSAHRPTRWTRPRLLLRAN
jgi:hypothetical protein